MRRGDGRAMSHEGTTWLGKNRMTTALGPVSDRRAPASRQVVDPGRALRSDQAAADMDQTSSDADQTSSDADQAASATDQRSADRDQQASDRDQAAADRDHGAGTPTALGERAYLASREERETVTVERQGNELQRQATTRDREETARDRDRVADARDEAARDRDKETARLIGDAAEPGSSLIDQLERLSTEAAADRARAAGDRARAARDRLNAARERQRLEAELQAVHLDELTGAYRRELGQLALTHEIDRARRSDGRFILVFVDVDRLKAVNDREGHAAGDRVLQVVAHALQTRLRSFDPIVRYGGDEFVCGLGGADIAEVSRRFDSIVEAIQAEVRGGISFGMATLAADDTLEQLIDRADVAMLQARADRQARD